MRIVSGVPDAGLAGEEGSVPVLVAGREKHGRECCDFFHFLNNDTYLQ
jgi:hypothetical protein